MMLAVSAFAGGLILLKQCQGLKNFNLNLILICNIPPLPLQKKKRTLVHPYFGIVLHTSLFLCASLAQVGCKYIITIIAGAVEL